MDEVAEVIVPQQMDSPYLYEVLESQAINDFYGLVLDIQEFSLSGREGSFVTYHLGRN